MPYLVQSRLLVGFVVPAVLFLVDFDDYGMSLAVYEHVRSKLGKASACQSEVHRMACLETNERSCSR
jgi:hypothetical protein